MTHSPTRAARSASSIRLLTFALLIGACALGCDDGDANPAAALGEPDGDGWDSAAALTLAPATAPAGLGDLDATFYEGVSCGARAEDLVDLFVPNDLTRLRPSSCSSTVAASRAAHAPRSMVAARQRTSARWSRPA